MATTSLWSVRGGVGKVIGYASNPAKTTLEGASGDVDGDLDDVLRYSMRPEKTGERALVTGIGCVPETAAEEMRATKRQYGKTGGVTAFHGYQSFAPGEADGETAHAIGVALASELWGDRFEVVVATHIDRSHVHNHFVVNSVSFADGRRFHRDAACYRAMRDASDRLCRERGLSVPEGALSGASRHYAEWAAERSGQSTWRALVKADVDEALARAATERQLWANLAAIGYEVKHGKDTSVRPPGKQRFVRLARNFGEAYSPEGLRRRILENRLPGAPVGRGRAPAARPAPVPRGSIVALYRQWLYLLGGYRAPGRRAHFLVREDVRHMERIARECAYLADNGVRTLAQLDERRNAAEGRIEALVGERRALRNAARRRGGSADEERLASVAEELRALRAEARMCRSIKERSEQLPERLAAAGPQGPEQERRQEDGGREPGGRADRAHSPGGQRDGRAPDGRRG